jgi:hypothetical protein
MGAAEKLGRNFNQHPGADLQNNKRSTASILDESIYIAGTPRLPRQGFRRLTQ